MSDGTGGNSEYRGYIEYDHGSDYMRFGSAAAERMRLDSSGRLGVATGATSPTQKVSIGSSVSETVGYSIDWTGSNPTQLASFTANTATGEVRIGATNSGGGTYFPTFYSNNSEAMRLDTDGRLLVGTTTEGFADVADNFTIADSGNCGMTIRSGSSNAGSIDFSDATSGSGEYDGYIDYQHSSQALRFGTNAGTERMRISGTGYAQFGGYLVETNNHRINGIGDTQGDTVLVVSGYQTSGGASQDTAMFYAVNTGGSVSQSGAGLRMYRNTSTNRSINTAGTINASGADYAEYMTKAGDFTLAKGDICGINSEGKLTNVFADAISFVVKSTDPSYVGGDTWHTAAGEEPGGYEDTRTEEEIAAAKVIYEEALEAARQLVDRIAFSGQVPVNVTGATPGQHIIPTAAADGSIEGTAKAEADLTMAEYMSSVGKVIAIEDDGRAKIIVKVS